MPIPPHEPIFAMKQRRWIAVAALAVFGACGEKAHGPEAGSNSGTSSGQAAANDKPLWSPEQAWTVGERPALEIGAAEGARELQFSHVSGALRLGNGRIAVADGGSGQVRFFSPAGAYLGSAGRPGGGPGEFESLSGIYARGGDSVLVLDTRAARLTLIGPAGQVSRTATLQPHPSRAGGEGIGTLADGSLVVRWAHGSPAVRTGVRNDSVSYLRYSPAGALLDTIALDRAAEEYMQVQGRNINTTTPLFARRPLAAAQGEYVFVAYNEADDIRVYAPDGTLARRVRFGAAPRRVTSAHVDAAMERIMEGTSEGQRGAVRRRLSEIPVPKTLPTAARMLADEQGNLWIQGSSLPGEERASWRVLDSSGRLLGSVTLPARFRPTQIGAGEIVGIARDELGVEYIRVYPLRKPAR